MADDSEKDYGAKTPAQMQDYWTRQVSTARKRLKNFLKQGNRVVDRFLDERAGGEQKSPTDIRSKLNLFFTNISTLQSMLYGSTPKTEVSREHADPDDDVARVAALMLQRILQADIDPSGENLPTVLKACLQDRLLPGLGVARVRYDMKTKKVAQPGAAEEMEALAYENVLTDYVHWQDFIWGWSRTWAELPWIAFRAYLSKDEATQRFGAQKANVLDYKNQTPSGDKDHGDDRDQQNTTEKAQIWEIWCIGERQVYWFSEGAPALLDLKDDPLGLSGFWPTPLPMIANITTKMLVPRADYVLAQDLYNEIDELQSRIAIITRAIKVVGVYDQNAGASVGRMLKEGNENDLIPVDNWAMFAERGGLQGSIDWFPVETVTGVLNTLQGIQQQKIQQLYEVTGLSDILRGGNTDEYTAQGTQAMKLKMGSIRVQALQDEFARFASDLQALKAEVIARHFSPDTIVQQSGAMFLSQGDQQLIQPALQLIKNPALKWRVNIRPESIAMVDYAQLKSERSEFLTAMATYLQSAQAVVQAVPGSLPILLQLLQWGLAGFKGAAELEGVMDQAIQQAIQSQKQQAEKPQPPSPEELRLQTVQAQGQIQQMKGQQDLQKIQAKAAADLQTTKTKVAGEIQKIMADAQRDTTFANQEAMKALQEVAAELDADLQTIAAKLHADLSVEAAQSGYAIDERDVEHDHTMEEIKAQAKARPTNGSGEKNA